MPSVLGLSMLQFVFLAVLGVLLLLENLVIPLVDLPFVDGGTVFRVCVRLASSSQV